MSLAKLRARPLPMQWTAAPDTARYRLCNPIASGADEPCHLAIASGDDGDRAVVLRVVGDADLPEEADLPDPFGAFERHLDVGTCELGTVLVSAYVRGASLADLASVALTWPTAESLFAAFAEPLAVIHGEGITHGALTARRLRLALDEPFPVRFVAAGGTAGDRAACADELAVVARAICALTAHPDPAIAPLLADPDGGTVLRDLLLERARPVTPLLRAVARVELPMAGVEPPGEAELAALWQHVLAIEPL